MRRILTIMALIVVTVAASAQKHERRPFDPQKFEQKLEAYVIQQVGFSQEEEKVFLPIFREMRQKQIKIMQNHHPKDKPKTEKEWETTLRERDNNEVQLKKIQQTYHNRMLKVVPASKVAKAIRAEDEFHREAFKQIHQRRDGNHERKGGSGQRRGKRNKQGQQTTDK